MKNITPAWEVSFNSFILREYHYCIIFFFKLYVSIHINMLDITKSRLNIFRNISKNIVLDRKVNKYAFNVS